MIEAKIDPDKKLLFALFFVAIILGGGYTYSYFSSKRTSEEQTIETGNLLVEYIENNEGIINSSNISPIMDADMENKATKLNFSVENSGNVDAKYSISFTDLSIDSELINSDFKWALYSGNTVINSGNFSDAVSGSEYVLTDNKTLQTSQSTNYTLYIWISETGIDQSLMMDKNFSAKVSIKSINNN